MDLDKIKALALAATPGPWSAIEWTCAAPTTVRAGAVGITVADTTGHGRNSEVCAIDAAFIAAANPATVLELIAEVERLRAAKRPKDHNIQQLVNDLRNISETFNGTGQLCARISDAVGQFIDASFGTAPAAGTEKDAERYRAWRAQVISGDDGGPFIEAMQAALPIQVNLGRTPTTEEWDIAIDAAIAAHSKAGKDG
jgi:hypothetical protein